MRNRLRNWWLDQRGSIVVLAGLGMVAFAGIAALGVDVGHIVSVKSEMQKAADSAALAGARALYSYTDTGLHEYTVWNWTTASNKATTTVQANSVDGAALSTAAVATGWWDLTWTPLTAPANLKASQTSLSNDVPAVKVTINKSGSTNGGPVPCMFGPLLGKSAQDVSISAVAVLTPASGVTGRHSPGPVFPIAVRKDFVDKWRSSPATVHIRPDSPTNDPDDGHRAGQWTSFNFTGSSDRQNNDYTATSPSSSNKAYIYYGNPDVLKVGNDTYIDSAKKATNALYTAAKNRHYPPPSGPAVDFKVLLPVVASNVDMFSKQGTTKILGFVPFEITGVSDSSGEKGGGGYQASEGAGGGDKISYKCYTYLYIKGKFLQGYYVIPGDGSTTPGAGTTPSDGSGGGGANFGLYAGIPKLVK